MDKEIKFNKEAKELIKEGIDEVTNAVKSTLGPMGKNVIIRDQETRKSRITKDGITVLKSINYFNEYKSIGAELIRDISEAANDISGDGSTTSAVIGQAIIHEGLKYISEGSNPIIIKRGIDKAIKLISDELTKINTPLKNNYDMLHKVAMVSTNNDEEISKIVTDVMNKVGPEGIVSIENANGIETYIDMVDGYKFADGWKSQHFVTDKGKLTVEYDEPLILVSTIKIEKIEDIEVAIDFCIKSDKPLIIVAKELSDNVFDAFVDNVKRGNIKAAYVEAPGFSSYQDPMTEDLALFLGATPITKEIGTDNLTQDWLGYSHKVIITRDDTTFIGGFGKKEDIEEKTNNLKIRLKSKTVSDHDKEIIKERISKLNSTTAVIFAGGTTEVEQKEIKDRYYDAIGATRSALEEGIVAGGGVTLARTRNVLHNYKTKSDDEAIAFEIVGNAILKPAKQIIENAGYNSDEKIKDILKKKDNWGYNVVNDKMEDLFKAGIFDPVKVIKIALEKAGSIAGLFLTTDCVITNKM